MDALKFLRERKRMCNLYENCASCPLTGTKCIINTNACDEDYKKMIATVEQWSEEHPSKTRQSVLLDKFPETILDEFGVIRLCPMHVSIDYRGSDGECTSPENICIDCRRKFWMQEVE